MHHAAYHGHADVVEVLLRHGARACPGGGTERERAEEGSETGRRGDTTPLHLAARSNALDAVMVLLAGGANPRAVDASGWTPRALAEECASRGRSDRAAHAAVDAALRVAEGGRAPPMEQTRARVVSARVQSRDARRRSSDGGGDETRAWFGRGYHRRRGDSRARDPRGLRRCDRRRGRRWIESSTAKKRGERRKPSPRGRRGRRRRRRRGAGPRTMPPRADPPARPRARGRGSARRNTRRGMTTTSTERERERERCVRGGGDALRGVRRGGRGGRGGVRGGVPTPGAPRAFARGRVSERARIPEEEEDHPLGDASPSVSRVKNATSRPATILRCRGRKGRGWEDEEHER